jgi:iron complex transport system substrate-binding protein
MRIVSLISSGTEILFALGLGPQVLAVSHECDWPPEARSLPVATRSRIDSSLPSLAIDQQVKRLLAAGEALYEVDAGLLRELRPDLIVTQAQCDVCAIRLADVLQLRETAPELAGCHVLPLNPMSLEDVLDDVRRVGQAAGATARGEMLVEEYRQRIARVETTTASLPIGERPRVLCVEWIEPLMAAGNWTPALIDRAGGQSGLAKAGQHSGYTSWSDVVVYDPEVILVAPCGFDLRRTLAEMPALQERPEWSSLSAVKNGRVYALDGNALVNRSGPRLIESLELLAHLLHPERLAASELGTYWQAIRA